MKTNVKVCFILCLYQFMNGPVEKRFRFFVSYKGKIYWDERNFGTKDRAFVASRKWLRDNQNLVYGE